MNWKILSIGIIQFKYYTKLELTLEKLYIYAKLIVGTNYGLRYFLKNHSTLTGRMDLYPKNK